MEGWKGGRMEGGKDGTGHRAWGMEDTWTVGFGCQRSDIRSQWSEISDEASR